MCIRDPLLVRPGVCDFGCDQTVTVVDVGLVPVGVGDRNAAAASRFAFGARGHPVECIGSFSAERLCQHSAFGVIGVGDEDVPAGTDHLCHVASCVVGVVSRVAHGIYDFIKPARAVV